MSNRIPCTEWAERLKVTVRLKVEGKCTTVQSKLAGNFFQSHSRCNRASNRRDFGIAGWRESVDRRRDRTSARSPSAIKLSRPLPPRWERPALSWAGRSEERRVGKECRCGG